MLVKRVRCHWNSNDNKDDMYEDTIALIGKDGYYRRFAVFDTEAEAEEYIKEYKTKIAPGAKNHVLKIFEEKASNK